MNSCSQSDSEPTSKEKTSSIVATLDDGSAMGESRTAIHGGTSSSPSYFGIVWNKGDQIGVFTKGSEANCCYTYEGDDRAKRATFTGNASGTPLYAYYPYSAEANGSNPAALRLTVPAEQPTTGSDCALTGDYKIGRPRAEGSNEFVFEQVLAMARIQVNAQGTALEDQKLRSVKMTVERADIVGSFTLNATKYDDPKTAASNFSNTGNGKSVTVKFTDNPSLASTNYAFISFFPTIKENNDITFTIETSRKIATVKVKAAADFQAGYVYSIPLTANFLNDATKTTIIDNPNPEIEYEYVPMTGEGSTFVAATYNVDGLPSIINSDGPGESGTTTIGQKMNSAGWDIIAVGENFEYNSQLVNAMTNYSSGTYRGSVGLGNVAFRADTDGLNFFWHKDKVSSEETKTWIKFQHEAGGIDKGANTCIKKGFRYYLVTLKNGVEIDVYITHMNTSGDGGRTEAQNEQLTEIADYILQHHNTDRPIIFMGDTNLRYTRNKVMQNLYEPIRNAGLTINDPWIDYMWDGDYYGVANHGKSIMTTGPNSTTNPDTDDFGPDGNGYGYQKGEIVDKVFYINKEGNDYQIVANGYNVDNTFTKEDGTPLADHYPVAIEFTVLKKELK